MTRISTICVVSSALAVFALSTNGASAATINVPPVHVVVSPPPKNASQGTTGINHINKGGDKPPPYDKPPPSYPEGIQWHTNGTVTIDGKTMPINKAAEKYMRQATTPPPKMWVGNQLVPITPANVKRAQELALGAHRYGPTRRLPRRRDLVAIGGHSGHSQRTLKPTLMTDSVEKVASL